jgi:hypothetical protein
MRDIVATIQAEQDEIIRLDHPEVLVIEGGPGTGKTVVALHRVILLGVLRRASAVMWPGRERDNAVATGLFAGHYQQYDVVWNGEHGKTIMFQNEMPYDPPNQAAWRHDGIFGYAAYKVAGSVETHEAWGIGSYRFFNVDPTIHASHAFEVPVTPGLKFARPPRSLHHGPWHDRSRRERLRPADKRQHDPGRRRRL